ncbi:hypothetical protein [Microcoleus sp. FACHB-672]|nr:hypothetical protein [Microcoleus sp. FACHB-672]MBD2039282.1 hypothetical protein [Microcoleus sp. FACHB-672]
MNYLDNWCAGLIITLRLRHLGNGFCRQGWGRRAGIEPPRLDIKGILLRL